MMPDDFATDLSNHLRNQGAAFDPVALQAFAADQRNKPAGDHDIVALAQRFRDWQHAAARALDRRCAKAWVEGACIAGVGSVILGIGALGVLCPIIGSPPATANYALEVTWFLITGGIMFFGAAIAALGLSRGVRASRRLAADAEQAGDSDATS
jgi:hypothetical protein